MYPLFVPPNRLLNGRRPKQWTDDEAQFYLEWLLSVQDLRVAALLKELELPPASGESEAEYLREAGKRATDRLASTSYSTQVGKGLNLTGQGSALAADMGLLVAQLLVRASGQKIHWSVRKEPMTDASYNLPVLFGTHPRMALDPIGGSMVEAKAVLRGKSTPAVWSDIFRVWLQKLLS